MVLKNICFYSNQDQDGDMRDWHLRCVNHRYMGFYNYQRTIRSEVALLSL